MSFVKIIALVGLGTLLSGCLENDQYLVTQGATPSFDTTSIAPEPFYMPLSQ